MIGLILALSALLALGYTKAIVTNNCRKDVYIWSVPEKPYFANNISVGPGKRYEEPWRSGTAVTPGVAIKITAEPNGIYTGKSEINFQYSVDPSDSSKVWVNLANVRGYDFNTATLNTCHGVFKAPSGSTEQCWSTDDIELVLCGSERTVPAQDTTPLHIISDCIGRLAERDDPILLRMCGARVVGPKRMPMLPNEPEDQYRAERASDYTLPLKTVMRLEAAKHAAAEDAEAHDATLHGRNTAAAYGSTPMCNLFLKGWPDVLCDEDLARHSAELFYQDNCGPKAKGMFPGDSCEAIRRDIEKIYPYVVKRDVNKTICINYAYEKLTPIWGSSSKPYIKSILNNGGPYQLLYDVSWTSDEEQCRQPASNNTIPVPDWLRNTKPPKYCVRAYGTGSELEDALDEVFEHAGKWVDFTTTDDECERDRVALAERDFDAASPTKRDRKALCVLTAYDELFKFPYWTSRRFIKDWLNNEAYGLFQDILWTSDEEQCRRENNTIPLTLYAHYHTHLIDHRPCVKPFCDHGHCSDVEDALNFISRIAGKNVDWTTDTSDADLPENRRCVSNMRSAPGHVIRRPISQGSFAPEKRFAPAAQPVDNTITAHRLNDVRNVCIATANEKLGKYFGPDITERLVTIVFPHTRWTSNLDDCSPRAISESQAYHRKLIDKKQHKEKRCLQDLGPLTQPRMDYTEAAGPRDSVLPCEGKTCKRLKKDLNTLSNDVGEHWDWTDDEELCAEKIEFGEGGPEICKSVLGDDTVKRLHEYWGEAYESILKAIYPDFHVSDFEPNCDNATYVNAAKKWFHDHRVKGKRSRRCVEPYCVPYNADCSDVEDDLEDLSRNIGHNTDWTTDDDACPKGAIYTLSDTALDRNATNGREICIKESCEYLALSDTECKNEAKFFQDYISAWQGVNVTFTPNGPVCEQAGQLSQLQPLNGKRSPEEHEVCKHDFCRRSNHINHDCRKMERDFQVFLNMALQMDVKFTDNNNVCAPVLATASRPSNSTGLHWRSDKRALFDMEMSVCLKDLCQRADKPATECLEMIEELESRLSAATGLRIKYRNDPNVCHGATEHIKVCDKGLCLDNDYGCKDEKQNIKTGLEGIIGVDVEFTDSNDVCGSMLARAAFGKPSQVQSGAPIHCSRVYCEPHVPGVDCAMLERDFSTAFPGAGGVSGNENACLHNPLLYRAPTYNKLGKRLMCVKDFCSLPNVVACYKMFPAIERYYADVHGVEIKPSLGGEACGRVARNRILGRYDDLGRYD